MISKHFGLWILFGTVWLPSLFVGYSACTGSWRVPQGLCRLCTAALWLRHFVFQPAANGVEKSDNLIQSSFWTSSLFSLYYWSENPELMCLVVSFSLHVPWWIHSDTFNLRSSLPLGLFLIKYICIHSFFFLLIFFRQALVCHPNWPGTYFVS